MSWCSVRITALTVLPGSFVGLVSASQPAIPWHSSTITTLPLRGYSAFRQDRSWLPARPLGCLAAWIVERPRVRGARGEPVPKAFERIVRAAEYGYRYQRELELLS